MRRKKKRNTLHDYQNHAKFVSLNVCQTKEKLQTKNIVLKPIWKLNLTHLAFFKFNFQAFGKKKKNKWHG